MASDLLSVCQAASEEVIFTSPESIIGNGDLDAVLLKRLATQTCKELARDYPWQALKKSYSYDTVAGVDSYALPSDLRSPVSLTFWDRTGGQALRYASNISWQSLKSGFGLGGVSFSYQQSGNMLNLSPMPSYATTIAFDYYSKSFCTNSAGDPQMDFTGDTDIILLDEDLVTRGIRYRFSERKGFRYADAKAEYIQAIDSLQGSDTPKGIIDFGTRYYGPNFPEGSWLI